MSKALNSPTARLLRSSRLFSLPPPLPASSLEAVSSSGFLRSSDTATLPYPTHQAISTPPSSRHRGDWGLKRPLPSRSIPKSNATLRIKAIDNIHHITEFASAADHTQTVEKWQEMQIPMSLPQQRDTMTRASRNMPIGAFEEEVDNTTFASSTAKDLDSSDISAERAIKLRHHLRSLPPGPAQQRWKTDGPWVNGLTEEQFQQYLAKTVRKNKAGFTKFLEQVKMEQKKKDAIQALRDEGLLSEQDPKSLEIELEKQSQLDEHELNDYVKQLRDENSGLSSELANLVRQYFDLPAFPINNNNNNNNNNSSSSDALYKKITQDLPPPTPENPPATHPSAGLSYLRTKAYMQNHPVYGPQTHHEPIQARVVKPRSAVGVGSDKKAVVGVGGFITEENGTATFNNRYRNGENLTPEQQYIAAVSQLDPDMPGGSKVWVQPNRASVDEKGHIQLIVDRADDQAVGVRTGNPIEAPVLAPSRYAGRMNEQIDRPLPGTPGNANYGRALPDERAPRRGARGFGAAELDDARGQRQAPAQQNSEDQIDMIQRLAKQHIDESRKGSQ